MKVELFYFDSCPSYLKALENTREALRLERLPENVELIAVESDADAQAKRFIGSLPNAGNVFTFGSIYSKTEPHGLRTSPLLRSLK